MRDFLILKPRFIGGFLVAFLFFALFYVLLNVGLRFVGPILSSEILIKGLAGFMAVTIALPLSTALLAESTSPFKQRARYATKGGLIVGLTAFLIGFVGPMIFTPGANQGPMLGLFITGPIGTFVGVVGGAIVWFVKRKGSYQSNI